MSEHKYVLAGVSKNALDKPIPATPQIEVIGGVTYLGGTVWPFGDARPLQIGYVGHKKTDVLIMTAICEGYNALNGYARVPLEGHPWPGLYSDYDDLPVSIHGGLTYGPESYKDYTELDLPPRRARTWTELGGWIGFDTAHAFDHWSDEAIFEAFASTGKNPSDRFVRSRRVLSEIESDFPPRPASNMDIMWTLERLIRETDLLAKQVLVAQMDAE
jgi:hypothetical protein